MDCSYFLNHLPVLPPLDPVTPMVHGAVVCLGEAEVYAEVGGSQLAGVLAAHPQVLAYVIPTSEQELGVEAFLERFWVGEKGLEAFFRDLRELQGPERIGVYLYDGPGDYRSVLLGLLLVRPFLAQTAVILVTQGHQPGVRQAVGDFLATQPRAKLVFDLTALPEDWSGLQVIAWGELSPLLPSPTTELLTQLRQLQEYSPPDWPNLSDQQLWDLARQHPHQPLVWHHLAQFHRQRQAYPQAELAYSQGLGANPGEPNLCLGLAVVFSRLRRHQEVIKLYEQQMHFKPYEAGLWSGLAFHLAYLGLANEAWEVAQKAWDMAADCFYLRLVYHLALPVVYDSLEEIDQCRRRYGDGLGHLAQEAVDNSSLALVGIGADPYLPFYLAAQGRDDRHFQEQYAAIVEGVMKVHYPQWQVPLPPAPEGKVRVGYVSEFMRSHTVAKLFRGWLAHHDREKFTIYSYYIRREVDEVTREIIACSDHFHQIPDDLAAMATQIRADQLHILVYLDIGMEAQIAQMAALRLAPVQAMAWGHPVTSGLSTIDYFISSALMEPDDGQAHYSETLVCLEGAGIVYAQPRLPELTRTRADFSLRPEACLYLSCQSLHKYLPQYDFVFPAIAQGVPAAQFVFIGGNAYAAGRFHQRLKTAFAAQGLDSDQFCSILPFLSSTAYLDLNRLCDVYLDTFAWSGGNTTLEAIACGLPIVTCPGSLMRGRHSYALLRQLGITETIAQDEQDYIRIAIALGQNPAWRRQVTQAMARGFPRLYGNNRCMADLEAFYLRVAGRA